MSRAAATQRGFGPPAVASIRFDWLMVALGGWLIGGLYLDGWAHHHVPDLETFFTPWHAVLYSGMLASLAVLTFFWAKNIRRGLSWRMALPRGYGLSLVGAVLFGIGGLADLVWHELFGIEVDIDALLSPTHLVLALGGLLIGLGPLRSTWARSDQQRGLTRHLPMVLSLSFVLSLFTFFTQFAHPLVEPFAARGGPDREGHSEVYAMNADGTGQVRLMYSTERGYREPSWSQDGRLMVFVAERDRVRDLYMRDTRSGTDTRLTDDKVAESFPVLSPDGSRVAFLSVPAGSRAQLSVLDLSTRAQRVLVEGRLSNLPMAWSPDGSRIAYTSAQSGMLSIYTIAADGSGLPERLKIGMPSAELSWSPDGRRMVFAGERGGNVDIYVMDIEAATPVRLTQHDAFDAHPLWSPEGGKIAFTSRRDGDEEIYVMNADGSNLVNVTNKPASQERLPSWSPDGRIAFESHGRVRTSGSVGQELGVASILLQTALLMGTLLLVLRRWPFPPGGLTMVLTLNGVLVSVLEDQYLLAIPIALAAGMVGDVMLWRLKPSAERPGALRMFAFGLPVVVYGLYFIVLGALEGIGWPVELWAGSIVLAGVIGLLLSYVAVPPQTPTVPQRDT